jgi:NAD(P)-dependent dehydrogenase (short-subunit alcohol dehydrogenase family)
MASNLFDLSGKRAVVTGASRGLGQYMARALGLAGADLAITSRTAASCEPFAAEMRERGVDVKVYSLDVRDRRSIGDFTERALQECGRIDIVVNNAGCNIRKPAVDVTWDDWDTVIDTNLKGSFFVATGFARPMLERGAGRVINVGSVTSVFGFAGIAPYSASRGGVLQMSRALASEWGPGGVTVNCLAPGWFETEQTRVLYEDATWLEYIVERIPVGRVGRPDDLDGVVVFLASDASSYLSGQLILVDGGITTGNMRSAPRRGAQND